MPRQTRVAARGFMPGRGAEFRGAAHMPVAMLFQARAICAGFGFLRAVPVTNNAAVTALKIPHTSLGHHLIGMIVFEKRREHTQPVSRVASQNRGARALANNGGLRRLRVQDGNWSRR